MNPKSKAPDRTRVEQLLHRQREAGLPGLTAGEIADALQLPTASVRVILKNIHRTKKLIAEKTEGPTRYGILYVKNLPPIGPLTKTAAKPSKPAADAATVYPPGYTHTCSPSAQYQPLTGYRLGSAARPGANDHLQHSSLRGNLRVAHSGRAVAVLGRLNDKTNHIPPWG